MLETVTNFATTAVTLTITAPPSTEAIIGGNLSCGATANVSTYIYYSSLSVADIAPSVSVSTTRATSSAGNYDGFGPFANARVVTDGSSQIRRRGTNTNNASTGIDSSIYGWVDARGTE